MKSLKLALGGALLTAFLVYGASVASGPAGWGLWGDPSDPTGEVLVCVRITGVDGRDLLIDQPRDSGSLVPRFIISVTYARFQLPGMHRSVWHRSSATAAPGRHE